MGGGKKLNNNSDFSKGKKGCKEDWMILMNIALSLIFAGVIIIEVLLHGFESPYSKAKPQQKAEQSEDKLSGKSKENELQGRDSYESKDEGEIKPRQEIFSAERFKNLVGFGLQIMLAMAAIGIAVFQVADKYYSKDRKEVFKRKVCNYATFMVLIILFYVLLFILSEYSYNNPNLKISSERVDTLNPRLSGVLIIVITFLLLHAMFIFVELFEVKVPKWLKVIAIVIAGIGVFIVESIVLFF